jgi:hypothetical protein
MQEYEKLRREIDALLADDNPAAPPATRATPATPATTPRPARGGMSLPTADLAVAGGIAAVVFVVCGLLPFVPALGPAVGAFIGALVAGWLVPRLTGGRG